jgi:hypothetical protein
MPKYKPVNYRNMCNSVLFVTRAWGSPQPLKKVVERIEHETDLGVNISLIKQGLGNHIVEHVDEIPTYGLDGNVNGCIKKVTTLVKV